MAFIHEMEETFSKGLHGICTMCEAVDVKDPNQIDHIISEIASILQMLSKLNEEYRTMLQFKP